MRSILKLDGQAKLDVAEAKAVTRDGGCVRPLFYQQLYGPRYWQGMFGFFLLSL